MIVVVDVTNTPLKLSAQRKWRWIFSELSETEFMLADKVCFPSCLNIVLMSRVNAKIPSGQILFRSVLVSGNINYILLQQPPCIVIFFMWIPIQQILLDIFSIFFERKWKYNKKWLISENNKLYPDIKPKNLIQNKWWKLFDFQIVKYKIFYHNGSTWLTRWWLSCIFNKKLHIYTAEESGREIERKKKIIRALKDSYF